MAASQSERRAPTVVDVARVAGVSRQTVSNVVNAPERVRGSTRERVERAIAELGYRPHHLARNLRTRRAGSIGYRVPLSDGSINPVLDRFLHALTVAARHAGYHILLFTPEESAEDVAAEIAMQDDLLQTSTVDGFIVAQTNYGDARVERLAAAGVPFAAFGRTGHRTPYPWVDVDGAAGTHQAVDHLAGLGHRRIAFLGWHEGSLSGDERARGYREGLAAAGLEAEPNLDVRGADGLETGGRALRRWMESVDPPTAVVAASDLLALGVLKAARSRGLRVGEDLAVTGFDDTPVAAFMSPPLTSVRQPLEEVATHVVAMVVALVAGGDTPIEGVLLAPDLTVRASTRPDGRAEQKGP